jgi:hypothetical protein
VQREFKAYAESTGYSDAQSIMTATVSLVVFERSSNVYSFYAVYADCSRADSSIALACKAANAQCTDCDLSLSLLVHTLPLCSTEVLGSQHTRHTCTNIWSTVQRACYCTILCVSGDNCIHACTYITCTLCCCYCCCCLELRHCVAYCNRFDNLSCARMHVADHHVCAHTRTQPLVAATTVF